MIPAPLPQPAPFTCSNCGAALSQVPSLCAECGEMVRAPKRLRSSTVVGRIASVFALLIWGVIAGPLAVALFLVVTRSGEKSLSMWAPVFLVALIVIGGLLASVSLFLRRTR